MLISAQEENNAYYNGTPGAGWALGWTVQQLTGPAETAETGGDYE